jgi:hypothetical protein
MPEMIFILFRNVRKFIAAASENATTLGLHSPAGPPLESCLAAGSAMTGQRRLRPVVARSAASPKGVRSLRSLGGPAIERPAHSATVMRQALGLTSGPSSAGHHALMARLTTPAHGPRGSAAFWARLLRHRHSVARPRPSSADRPRPSIPFSAVMARPTNIAHSVELPPGQSPSVQRQGFDRLGPSAPHGGQARQRPATAVERQAPRSSGSCAQSLSAPTPTAPHGEPVEPRASRRMSGSIIRHRPSAASPRPPSAQCQGFDRLSPSPPHGEAHEPAHGRRAPFSSIVSSCAHARQRPHGEAHEPPPRPASALRLDRRLDGSRAQARQSRAHGVKRRARSSRPPRLDHHPRAGKVHM